MIEEDYRGPPAAPPLSEEPLPSSEPNSPPHEDSYSSGGEYHDDAGPLFMAAHSTSGGSQGIAPCFELMDWPQTCIIIYIMYMYNYILNTAATCVCVYRQGRKLAVGSQSPRLVAPQTCGTATVASREQGSAFSEHSVIVCAPLCLA